MPVLRQAASTALYLAALLLGLALFNADAENKWMAFGIWGLASLLLGFLGGPLVGGPAAVLVGIPMALPFGYADQYLGSDATDGLVVRSGRRCCRGGRNSGHHRRPQALCTGTCSACIATQSPRQPPH